MNNSNNTHTTQRKLGHEFDSDGFCRFCGSHQTGALDECDANHGTSEAEAPLPSHGRHRALKSVQCVNIFKKDLWDEVNCVALSADGRWALSATGSIFWLWEVTTGRCVRQFGYIESSYVEQSHTADVRSIVLSEDGRWALSGSKDKTLRLWEVATGRCVRTFKGHTWYVLSVALSSDGRWALSGGGDNQIRLWQVDTGLPIRIFEGHMAPVYSVIFNSNCRFALSGSADKTLRLWEVATGRCVRMFEGHSGPVISMALSGDGRFVLSGSTDKTLRLWEMATGRCIRIFESLDGAVESVALSVDGCWALSVVNDNMLRVWEAATGCCVISSKAKSAVEGCCNCLNSIVLSKDDHYAVSGGSRGMCLWELSWDKYMSEALQVPHPAEGARTETQPSSMIVQGKATQEPSHNSAPTLGETPPLGTSRRDSGHGFDPDGFC